MNKQDAAVAIYPSHSTAEAAVKDLQQSVFDMKKPEVRQAIETLDGTQSESLTEHPPPGDKSEAGQLEHGALVSA